MLRGFLDLPIWQHRRSAVLELGHEFDPCQRLVWIALGNLNAPVPPRAAVQHDLHDIWNRPIPVDFVLVPKFCRNPAAFEAAIPSAIWTCGPVNPRSFAAAATAPRAPIVAVGCQP